MNTNALADIIVNKLVTLTERVYRNRPNIEPPFPYVIFTLDSSVDTFPSFDYTLNIDLFDSNDVTSRALETLGDTIETELNHLVVNDATLNAQFELSSRGYVGVKDLVEAQAVRIAYDVRVYFK